MKNLHMTSIPRHRERGSVAILIAFMWTALFGMAVVAVDFGYLYTKRRNVQAAADAAVIAGMPFIAGHDQNGATTRAAAVATKNLFTGGDIVTNTATATQLTVTLKRAYPTFFGSVLGMTPKEIRATSIGRMDGGLTGPAIHSNDTASVCSGPWGNVGVEVTGGGHFLVNGDVTSMGKIHIGNMGTAGSCDPATNCRITGAARTACASAIWNDDPTEFGMPTQLFSQAVTDPLAGHNLAWFESRCTHGTSTLTPHGGLPWIINACPGGDGLPANSVFCASDGFSVNPPSGTLCPSTTAFISGGALGITTSGSVTLTGPGATDGIIAFSAYSGGGPAIQLSNGPSTLYTMTGHVYAPAGLVNVGTGTPGFTMTGMLVGGVVVISTGPSQPWVFTGPGGGSGTWHLYR
jgi:Flp pilus assembly protein TadG